MGKQLRNSKQRSSVSFRAMIEGNHIDGFLKGVTWKTSEVRLFCLREGKKNFEWLTRQVLSSFLMLGPEAQSSRDPGFWGNNGNRDSGCHPRYLWQQMANERRTFPLAYTMTTHETETVAQYWEEARCWETLGQHFSLAKLIWV